MLRNGGIDLYTQTDGFNVSCSDENHLMKNTLTQDQDVQTDEPKPHPDDELKKKLLEFIGGKLAKFGDNYDKGSSFFTKSS